MSFSSFLGGIFGAGLSGLSSFLSYNSAKKLQQHQYDLNLKTLENAPSASRKGFESAGYNPLYALGANNPGFSANSAGVPFDLTTGMKEGVNSAIAVKQNKATLKKIDAEVGQIDAVTKGVELENRIKEKQLNTSPKAILSDYIEGRENPVVKKVLDLGERFGILDPNKSKPNSAISAKRIKLHDDKPYVQRGVPRSVVKSFNGVNSAKSLVKFDVLSEKDLKNLKYPKKRYNKPPSQLPR